MDRKKKNIIYQMARNLSFTIDEIRHLSLDLFGKSYDALTDEDANEMITYLRLQDKEDFWGLEDTGYY